MPKYLMKKLLNASLAFEHKMLVLKWGSSHGGVSKDTLEKAKWKHIDLFEKAWANGKFCEIAQKRLLANAEWHKLFSNL
jgi:hypothetical protein